MEPLHCNERQITVLGGGERLEGRKEGLKGRVPGCVVAWHGRGIVGGAWWAW